jgi:hypothetical protein
MTPRKTDLALPSRTPAYVDRETGAAELGISPATWDRWVDEEILPAAAPGFPSTCPRWRWADVDSKMAAKQIDTVKENILLGAQRLKNVTAKNRTRLAS